MRSNMYSLILFFFVFMFYMIFQVPSSRGSPVLTETKGITNR